MASVDVISSWRCAIVNLDAVIMNSQIKKKRIYLSENNVGTSFGKPNGDGLADASGRAGH